MNLNDPGGQYNPYAAPAPDVGIAPIADFSEGPILADRLTRFGAFLIDRLLDGASIVPGCVLGFMVFFEAASRHGGKDDPDVVTIVIFVGLMFALLIPLNIYQWYLISKQGQTLGKKWLGVRIVKLDGSPVDFVSGVVMRNWLVGLMAFVPYLGFCFRMVDYLMIFTDERRCLHDQIAGTKVIVAG